MGFWFWVLALAALVVWFNLRGASRKAARSASHPAAPSRLETARLTLDLSVPSDPASSQASVAVVDLDAWMAGLSADDLRLVERYGIKRTSQGFFCRHRRFETADRVLDHARALQSGAAVAPPLMCASATPSAPAPTQAPDRPNEVPNVRTDQSPSANFAKPDNARPRWYGSADPIEISGVRIVSPMVYVGPTRSYETPRDRVDPTARVGLTGEDQLGIALSYFADWTTGSMAQVLAFVLLVVFLQFRPQGLFTVRTRGLT